MTAFSHMVECIPQFFPGLMQERGAGLSTESPCRGSKSHGLCKHVAESLEVATWMPGIGKIYDDTIEGRRR